MAARPSQPPGARTPHASGQATLELLALLPLAVAIVMVVFQLLAAGASRELAGNAAAAGAAALLQGLDPRQAAREALPGWSRSRVEIGVRGRRVRVRLRPVALVPGVAGALATTAEADAGPRAAGAAHSPASLERRERIRPLAGGARDRRVAPRGAADGGEQ